MPYIKATYRVSLSIDRYYRYNDGENPHEIEDMLFDNPYIGCYSYRDYSSVYDEAESMFDGIPHVFDLDVDYGSVDRDAEAPADESVPYWTEFVPQENVEAYRKGRLKERMEEEIESMMSSTEFDYDTLSAVLSALKAMNKQM